MSLCYGIDSVRIQVFRVSPNLLPIHSTSKKTLAWAPSASSLLTGFCSEPCRNHTGPLRGGKALSACAPKRPPSPASY